MVVEVEVAAATIVACKDAGRKIAVVHSTTHSSPQYETERETGAVTCGAGFVLVARPRGTGGGRGSHLWLCECTERDGANGCVYCFQRDVAWPLAERSEV